MRARIEPFQVAVDEPPREEEGMIRFIVREVYVGHVVHAQGQPETAIRTFDGDLSGMEDFLRYNDQPKGRPDYVTRELIGVELLPLPLEEQKP